MTHEARARQLAARNYSRWWMEDTYTTGGRVYVVGHRELRGCKSQGDTLQEAWANLDDARYEYILSLLEDGLPVPPPECERTVTGAPGVTCTYTFYQRQEFEW